jgi:hypothetical protein
MTKSAVHATPNQTSTRQAHRDHIIKISLMKTSPRALSQKMDNNRKNCLQNLCNIHAAQQAIEMSFAKGFFSKHLLQFI